MSTRTLSSASTVALSFQKPKAAANPVTPVVIVDSLAAFGAQPKAAGARVDSLADFGAQPKAVGARPKAPPKAKASPALAAATPKAAAVPQAERPKLKQHRRWSTWREKSVGIAAMIWAVLRVELEDDISNSASVIVQIQERFRKSLGEDAVIHIDSESFSLQNPRIFVCLRTNAEDCTDLWDEWRPMQLEKAKVIWKDTIDAGSSRLSSRLRPCWNPQNLNIDGMSLELPARWIMSKQASGKATKCPPGSHWHEFARIFGEVSEVYLVHASQSEAAYLVVHYLDEKPGGPQTAYQKLSGRCLYNPMTPPDDLVVIRASYGSFATLLGQALRQVHRHAMWMSHALPLPPPIQSPPRGTLMGPVFELCPLKGLPPQGHQPLQERLRIAPWGPKKVVIGKYRTCHLCITYEKAGVSANHAVLWLETHENSTGLFISDTSKNGTWVNEQRLSKETSEELKNGDVLRIADVPQYLVRRFPSLEICQNEARRLIETPTFRVPPCPSFIRGIRVKLETQETKEETKETRMPTASHRTPNLLNEIPRIPEETKSEEMEEREGNEGNKRRRR